MRVILARFWVGLILLSASGGVRGQEPQAAEGPAGAGAIPVEAVVLDRPVDFARDILPIFNRNCIACHHGEDAEGELILDDPRAMLTGGVSGPAVNVQQPDASLMLRVASRQEKPFMPPRRNKVGAVDLTPHELGLVRLWIEQGARGTAQRVRAAPQWQAPPAGWQPIYALAISPDWQHVAAGRGNRIDIYNLPLQKHVATLIDESLDGPAAGAAHRDAVQSLAFSPDGSLLASGSFRSIKIWRRGTSERRLKVPAPQSPARGAFIASSPDAKWLVTAGPGREVAITDLATGSVVKELVTTAPAVRDQQLAGDVLNFLRAELARATAVADEHSRSVTAQTAALTEAMTAMQAATEELAAKQAALDAASAQLAEAQKKQSDAVAVVAPSEAKAKESAEALAAAKAAQTMEAEQIAALEQAAQQAAQALQQVQVAQAEAAAQLEAATARQTEAQQALAAIQQVAAAAEQKIASTRQTLAEHQHALDAAQTAKARATAAVQEAETHFQQAGDALSAPRPPTAVAFSPDGSGLLIGSRDGSAQLFGLPGGGGPAVIRLHNAPVIALSFTTQGELISTAADGEVRIGTLEPAWRLERVMEPAETGDVPLDRVMALAFSPDGLRLASGGGVPSREGELLLWNIAEGRLVRQFERAHSDAVLDLAFFPDGRRLATAGADRFARVFDPVTGELLRTFEGHTNHVLSVSWNRNGQHLATSGADKVVKIWNFETGSQVRTIDGFDKPVTRVRYLGYREELAAGWGLGRVQVIHENGTRGKMLEASADYVHALDVTPDGRLLAAGGDDGALRLWEAPGGEVVATFPAP